MKRNLNHLQKSLSMVRQALVEGRVKLPGINPPYQYVRQPERLQAGAGLPQMQQQINSNQYLMKQLGVSVKSVEIFFSPRILKSETVSLNKIFLFK